MRICPTCSSFYAAESGGFCLRDGTPLVDLQAGGEQWQAGQRAIEKENEGVRKKKRRLRIRRIVFTTVAMLAVARIVYLVAFKGVVHTPLSRIEGQVKGPNGQLLPGVTLSLAGKLNATVTTDTNGNYSFVSLPAGDYLVTPSSEGTIFEPLSRDLHQLTHDERADFMVREVQPDIHKIDEPIKHKIDGQIKYQDRQLPFVIEVRLRGKQSATTMTDRKGNFSFAELLPGDYTVMPAGNEMNFKPRSLNLHLTQDKRADFVASDVALYKIEVQVKYLNGKLPSVVQLLLRGKAKGTATTDANGNYTFTRLTAGDYTVTPTSDRIHFEPKVRTVHLDKDQRADFLGIPLPPKNSVGPTLYNPAVHPALGPIKPQAKIRPRPG